MKRRDTLKTQVHESGVTPRKSRGQNFLRDESFARSIVDFGGVSGGESVLEIGPGTGVLTREILGRGAKLTVVEIEPGLAANLPKNVPGVSASQVVNDDIRNVRLREHFEEPVAVFGNVPYSLSTDLFFWLVSERDRVSRACFLMQKEFAERIAAPPGGRDYGILSVFRELYFDAALGPTIGGENFYPPAAVDSTVLLLRARNHPLLEGLNQERFKTLVRAAFGQRRKTLVNSLLGSAKYGERKQIESALSEVGIDGMRRAETLSLDEFVQLSRVIKGQDPEAHSPSSVEDVE